MEESCSIKTGFFVLRLCPNLPQFTCGECQRSICQQHTREEGSQPLCIECHAKRKPRKEKADSEEEDWDDLGEDFLSDDWYYATRSHYYSRHHGFSAFSEDDYEGFDRAGHQEFLDDRDTGSLFDS